MPIPAMPHDHAAAAASDRRLIWAVAINIALTAAEVVAGVVSGSLALIADAVHNLGDAAALGLALFARRMARRPADRLMTFGYARAEPVAALINLTSLLTLGFYLCVEAIGRFLDPQPIEGWTVIAVAALALVIDSATALLLAAGARGSLNVKAAFLHNVSDALASVGVILAGIVILICGWYWVDLVITLVIAGYVVWQGATMMPAAIGLLMDAMPADEPLEAIIHTLEAVPGVRSVHHVHVRTLDEHRRALEAHLVPAVVDLEQFETVKAAARQALAQRHRIDHATLEPCLAAACVMLAPRHAHPPVEVA